MGFKLRFVIAKRVPIAATVSISRVLRSNFCACKYRQNKRPTGHPAQMFLVSWRVFAHSHDALAIGCNLEAKALFKAVSIRRCGLVSRGSFTPSSLKTRFTRSIAVQHLRKANIGRQMVNGLAHVKGRHTVSQGAADILSSKSCAPLAVRVAMVTRCCSRRVRRACSIISP